MESALPMAGVPHPLFPEGHFILPDTNVFLSQVRVYGYTLSYTP